LSLFSLYSIFSLFALFSLLYPGLLWHSREKTDRKVRVSYFIAELYGRPDEYHDPWNSPLARLVKFADHQTFAHPVVCKVRGSEGRERGNR
jgi:hypothetical protein